LDRNFRAENNLPKIPISRSVVSVRADAKKVYDHLADKLTTTWHEFAHGEPFPQDAGKAEESAHFEQTTYVWRNDYYGEFKKLVESGARLIALVGQAGVGKTYLAKMLTTGREQVERYVPIIEVNRGQPSNDHIQAAAYRLQRPVRFGSREYLAELLYSDNSLPFVVLDNLESADELHRLVPTPPQSVVVATCRTKGLNPPDYCQFIDVGTMTEEESRELVVRELPGVSELDAAYLADSLYRYPLLIQHVCGLLRNQNSSIRDFCQDLHADESEFVGRIRLNEGRTLAAVLGRVVQEVQANDPLAYDLLACISFIGEWYGDREMHQIFLADYLAASLARPVSAGRYAEAVDILNRYSLIQFIGDSIGRIRIVVHPFAQEILRNFFSNQAAHIAQCAVQVIDRQKENFLPMTLAAGGTTELAKRIGLPIFFGHDRAKLQYDALHEQVDADSCVSIVTRAHSIYQQVRTLTAVAVQLAPHSAEIEKLPGFAAVLGRDLRHMSWGEGEPPEAPDMMPRMPFRAEGDYLIIDMMDMKNIKGPTVAQKWRMFEVRLDEFNT
jgi:hypothetical protein